MKKSMKIYDSFFFLIHRQQHLIIKYKYLTINVLYHLQKRKFGSTATYYNFKTKYLNLII